MRPPSAGQKKYCTYPSVDLHLFSINARTFLKMQHIFKKGGAFKVFIEMTIKNMEIIGVERIILE